MTKKIALIGCGRVSRRHIEAIESHDDLQIAVVCDADEAKARPLVERFGARYEPDLRQLRDVDVASIMTPSGLHPRHVCAVAEQTNIPNIICEKPLSLTVRELLEMYARVDAAGKRLLPVFQNRYNPIVMRLKELVAQGDLGRVYQAIVNVLWNRNDEYFQVDWHGTQTLDGGVLYTQASHFLDMMLYLFGEVDEAQGFGTRLRGLEVYDTLSACCKFRNGVVGSINATVNAYPQNYQTEMTLIAAKGLIRISGVNLNRVEHWEVENIPNPNLDFPIDHQYGKGHNQLYRYVADERWEMFPDPAEVLAGIRMMERLSA